MVPRPAQNPVIPPQDTAQHRVRFASQLLCRSLKTCALWTQSMLFCCICPHIVYYSIILLVLRLFSLFIKQDRLNIMPQLLQFQVLLRVGANKVLEIEARGKKRNPTHCLSTDSQKGWNTTFQLHWPWGIWLPQDQGFTLKVSATQRVQDLCFPVSCLACLLATHLSFWSGWTAGPLTRPSRLAVDQGSWSLREREMKQGRPLHTVLNKNCVAD